MSSKRPVLRAQPRLTSLYIQEQDLTKKPGMQSKDYLRARYGCMPEKQCLKRVEPHCRKLPISVIQFAKLASANVRPSFRHHELRPRRRWAMIEQGVYLPCSQFEAAFVSAAHTEADIDQTIRAAREALEKL